MLVNHDTKQVVASINFGLSKTKNISARAVYNAFDFVSDMGGIYGALVLIGTTF